MIDDLRIRKYGALFIVEWWEVKDAGNRKALVAKANFYSAMDELDAFRQHQQFTERHNGHDNSGVVSTDMGASDDVPMENNNC